MAKASAAVVFDYPHFGKVLFIFAAMLFISCAVLGGCRRPAAENFCGCARLEGFAGSATFYFMGVKWCGYCKNSKPAWDMFTKQLDDQKVKGVVARYVDCEVQPELAAQFKVQSYPTFIMVKADGSSVPYTGARTADAFLAFAKQHASA